MTDLARECAEKIYIMLVYGQTPLTAQICFDAKDRRGIKKLASLIAAYGEAVAARNKHEPTGNEEEKFTHLINLMKSQVRPITWQEAAAWAWNSAIAWQLSQAEAVAGPLRECKYCREKVGPKQGGVFCNCQCHNWPQEVCSTWPHPEPPDSEALTKTLREERDKYQLWANCGGVFTGEKCGSAEESGHDIYGPFTQLSDGTYRCEFHHSKEVVEKLQRQLAESQALLAAVGEKWKLFHDYLPDGEYKGLGEIRLLMSILSKRSHDALSAALAAAREDERERIINILSECLSMATSQTIAEAIRRSAQKGNE